MWAAEMDIQLSLCPNHAGLSIGEAPCHLKQTGLRGTFDFARVRIKKKELEPGLDLGISHFEWRSEGFTPSLHFLCSTLVMVQPHFTTF